MTLYEIDKEIMATEAEAYDEETGEILNEELFKKLDELHLDREKKIEDIILFRKNLLSDAEQLKAEADKFYNRAKSAERRAESLKNYIAYALGGAKFKTMKCSVSYRTTKSVEILTDNVYDLPEEFLRIKAEPNKTAIKEYLESGHMLNAADLIENQVMVIK